MAAATSASAALLVALAEKAEAAAENIAAAASLESVAENEADQQVYSIELPIGDVFLAAVPIEIGTAATQVTPRTKIQQPEAVDLDI